MSRDEHKTRRTAPAIACLASLVLMPSESAWAQQAPAPSGGPSIAAEQIADIFSKVGDEIYGECIFELSEEQIEVQAALILAYVEQGASGATARKLAATQIQPPRLSAKCERLRRPPEASPSSWITTTEVQKKPAVDAPKPKAPATAEVPKPAPEPTAPTIALADRQVLPQWDCASDVDFVTIHLNGYQRKLTGGEICNPYEDVVHEVPADLASFRLGYTIKTGRLFVIAKDSPLDGKTIAWAISGRDVCRNNPDPDCLAARAVGPLPPGEYSFSAQKDKRITWGPKTKRNVAAVYLRKLWNRDRFNARQTAAILKRGNIAIHVRLKGEMSEACLGLEPKGWGYVASLIKEARATGLNVYIDEPHPQVAEAPPLVATSTFSLTSLFK